MLRAVVLTQYLRVTDGQTNGRTDRQTDGIAVANTALAMRALRRAVISSVFVASLDISKAFDGVNHFKLYIALRAGIPVIVIDVVYDWYSKLS